MPTESHRDARFGPTVLEKAGRNRGYVGGIDISRKDPVFNLLVLGSSVFPAVKNGIIEGKLDRILPHIDAAGIFNDMNAINADRRSLNRSGIDKLLNSGNGNHTAADNNRYFDSLHDLIVFGIGWSERRLNAL